MIPSDSIEWGCAMYGTGTKKMLNMLILDILKEYSDAEHRLLQQDIIDLLETNYGISCERRAVKSNIVSLQDMGYTISVKLFPRMEQKKKLLAYLKEGAFVVVKATADIDNFDGELSLGYVQGIKKAKKAKKQ